MIFKKLTAKILGLVFVNAFFLAAVWLVGWWQMGRIGGDLTEISQVDLPLVVALNGVANQQLVQEAEIEKALRAAEVYKEAGVRQRKIEEHIQKFEAVESSLNENWDQALGTLVRGAESVQRAENRKIYRELAQRVGELRDDQATMQNRARQILDTLVIGGRVIPSVTEVLERDREKFAVELAGFLEEIDTLSATVAADAGTNRQRAQWFLTLFALIAFGVGLGWGWAVSRSVAAILRQLADSAETVSAQMLSAVQEQRASTTETASAITETTSTLDEFRQTAQSTADKARTVAEAAEQSMANSQRALDAVSQGITAMSDIRQEVEGIAHNILELSEKNIQIGEIVQSVNAIAEQSNLLAVNASIEAAKAGEQGKGFSVVAGEVRSLASQSKEATAQIRTILSETQKASNSAVMVTEQGTKRVLFGAGLIEELGQTIQQLADTIEDSFEAGRNISLTANQQLAGVEQIAAAMRNVEQAGRDNATGAEELEQAAHQVQDVSSQLTTIVEGR